MTSDFVADNPANNSTRSFSLQRTLRRRWLPGLGVLATVFAGVAIYTATRVPIYQSDFSIRVDNSAAPVPTEIPVTVEDLTRETQILKSIPLLNKAIKKLGAPYNNTTAAELAQKLVVQVQAGGVLMVTYRDTDPQRTQAVLTALAGTYIEYSVENKRSRSANAVKLIEGQLPKARKQLNLSATALRDFRQKYGIVDPAYAESVSKARQKLAQQAQSAAISLNASRRTYEALRQQVGANPDVALANTVLSQDPDYQGLLSQYNQAQTAYALALQTYSENSPQAETLRLRRDQLLNLLKLRAGTVLGSKAELDTTSRDQNVQQGLTNKLLEAQNTLVAQQAQLEGMRRAEAELAARFEQIPSLQLAYTQLQRQFQLNSDQVNSLLKRLQKLKAEAQKNNSWVVLSPPYLPTEPVSPDVDRNLLLGLIAGILLGLAIAALLESLDQRLEGVEEARLTKLPLLGSIPKVKRSVRVQPAPTTNPRNAETLQRGPRLDNPQFKESLYSLAFNLCNLGDNDVKTILFTSAIAAQGKSTIAYNLGFVLAELGLRVIVIDAELAKPTLHKFLQIPNSAGLTTAIATDLPWQQVVHSGGRENLDVMPAGPQHANPIALLNSAKISSILRECYQAYDYILIDAPPIVGADARSLISRVDASILVTAVGHERLRLSRAAEILQASGCDIAGLVVNFTEPDDADSYYQHYDYGEPVPEFTGNEVPAPTNCDRQATLNNLRG